GGLTKSTLTAGTGITITNGNGIITVVSSFGLPNNVQVFTSGTGTWSIPSTTNTLRFSLVGGGGGGGPGSTTGGGGGGGAGAFVQNYTVPKGSATTLDYFVGNGGPSNTGGATSVIIINSMNIVAYAGGRGSNNTNGGGGGGANGSASQNTAGIGDNKASITNYGIFAATGGITASGTHPGSVGGTAIYANIMSGSSGGSGGSGGGDTGGAGGASLVNY